MVWPLPLDQDMGGHGHLACERIKGDRRIDLIKRSRFAFS